MELVNGFFAQVGQLKTVWAPFAVAVIIVGIFLWRWLKHHYQGRLDTKDDIIKLREAQLQDYKDKLSGATPDEAKARLDALEARLDGIAPRGVNAEQKHKMLKHLDGFRGEVVEIVNDVAAPETAPFARNLAEVFRAAGWIVHTRAGMGLNNPPPTGILMFMSDPQNRTPAQDATVLAFKAAGFAHEVRQRDMDAREPSATIMLTSQA